MRLKSPLIAWATVFTESVFARPGTPSTRRCPRARSATRIRSSKWSCPTMTFLISKRRRPVSGGTALCWSAMSSLSLVRRDAERAGRRVDGHREADAAERRRAGRVHEPGHDTDDVTLAIHE